VTPHELRSASACFRMEVADAEDEVETAGGTR
jgi:hypothetical protein